MNAVNCALSVLVLRATGLARAAAEEPVGPVDPAPTDGPVKNEEEPVKADASTESTWDDLGFGIGVSFTFDVGENDRVKDAEVVDGIVRVTDEENGIPRLVLEAHYFFGEKPNGTSSQNFAHGPFVAIQPGDDDVINAAGIGYMIAFRRDADSKKSWNIGLGLIADPNVQVFRRRHRGKNGTASRK